MYLEWSIFTLVTREEGGGRLFAQLSDSRSLPWLLAVVLLLWVSEEECDNARYRRWSCLVCWGGWPLSSPCGYHDPAGERGLPQEALTSGERLCCRAVAAVLSSSPFFLQCRIRYFSVSGAYASPIPSGLCFYFTDPTCGASVFSSRCLAEKG